MRLHISMGIVTATLLAMSIAILPLSLEDAYAYNRYCGPIGLPGSTIGWKNTGLGTGTYLTQTQRALVLWNDANAGIVFDEVSLFEKVQIRAANEGPNGLWGFVVWPDEDSFHRPVCDSNGYLKTPAVLTLNTYYLDAKSNLEKVYVAAHELGHVLGIEHSDYNENPVPTYADQTLMYSTTTVFSTYKIFYPTLDDIRAAQNWYGTVSSTSTCDEAMKVNADIIHSGTCSSSNPAMPITEKLTAQNGKAFASQYSGGQYLPTSDALMITAKVKPTTIYRSQVGVQTNKDPTDVANRFMVIRAEGGSQGWKAVHSDTSGTGWVTSICTCTIDTTTTYFVQIVLISGEQAGVAVYKDDGGGTNFTPPTRLGSKLVNVELSWGNQVYYGHGVYGSQTLSNWDVKEFHNRLKSWT